MLSNFNARTQLRLREQVMSEGTVLTGTLKHIPFINVEHFRWIKGGRHYIIPTDGIRLGVMITDVSAQEHFRRQGLTEYVVAPDDNDHLHFVGGGAEDGETVLETVVRECQEEVGITPTGRVYQFLDINGSTWSFIIVDYETLMNDWDGKSSKEGCVQVVTYHEYIAAVLQIRDPFRIDYHLTVIEALIRATGFRCSNHIGCFACCTNVELFNDEYTLGSAETSCVEALLKLQSDVLNIEKS
jgi:8-oxo-dGTP pyrophosphatase MutT (NUDIX family)